MATLTIQNLVKSAELSVSYAAASAGGDVMPNDGKTVLHFKNASAGSLTVTVASALASHDFGDPFGPYTRADVVVAVPAGGERFVGPFPGRAFNNGSGQAAITYSGVTSLTVAALRFPG